MIKIHVKPHREVPKMTKIHVKSNPEVPKMTKTGKMLMCNLERSCFYKSQALSAKSQHEERKMTKIDVKLIQNRQN